MSGRTGSCDVNRFQVSLRRGSDFQLYVESKKSFFATFPCSYPGLSPSPESPKMHRPGRIWCKLDHNNPIPSATILAVRSHVNACISDWRRFCFTTVLAMTIESNAFSNALRSITPTGSPLYSAYEMVESGSSRHGTSHEFSFVRNSVSPE